MDEQSFQIARGLVFAVVLGLGVVLERTIRHAALRPAWRTNLGLWIMDAAVVGTVCGGCACTVARFAAQRGWGLLQGFAAPPVVAILATVVALDCLSYAWHRANHQVRFLWRFHRVHHGDQDFNVSTALRFHPGELLLSLPIRLAAIVLLGAPVAGVLAFEVVFMCANILEHGNFDLPRRAERTLATLLVTPALHRWHHSREVAELNTNFGTVFAVWDRILGTFRMNDSETRVTTGVPGRENAAFSLWATFVEPFRAVGGRERA